MNKTQTLDFPEMVDWLDSLKVLYYLSKTVREHASPVRPAAVALEEKLSALGYLSIQDAVAKLDADPDFMAGPYGKRMVLRTGLPLAAEFSRILEDADANDEKFYHEAGFGEFWNEVCLPAFIEDLLDSLARELQKEWPTLLGTEGMAYKAGLLKPGVVAISYYDLSDALLVFADMDSAMAFADDNEVEPSEFLVFWDNAWQCQ